MAIFEYLESWYDTRRRHSALGYLSPNDFERAAAAAGVHREGNGAPHHRDDLEVSSIDEPEIQNNPSEAPLPAVFDENFIPPAIAHLSAGGDSPQPSTETG